MRYCEILESHHEWNKLLIPYADHILAYIRETVTDTPHTFTHEVDVPVPPNQMPYLTFLNMIEWSVVDDLDVKARISINDRTGVRITLRDRDVTRDVIVHELRHAIQYMDYRPFFTGREKGSYDTDVVEIDATFHQVLSKTDPTLPAADFVQSVMDGMKVKTLTDKQVRHYRAQAGKYYLQARKNA